MTRLLTITFVVAVSIFLAGCGEPVANNGNAAKPASAGNNSANAAKTATDTAAVETEVKKVVADFEAALNKNDADAVGRFYDDSYTLIDQNGETHTKAARVEQIRSGKIKWEGLKFSDPKIRVHPAGDGAAVYARANGKVSMDGKTEDRSSMVTWIARKQADGWKFIHAQVTDIKGGSGAKPADEPAANK